jgi:hypothetical protein
MKKTMNNLLLVPVLFTVHSLMLAAPFLVQAHFIYSTTTGTITIIRHAGSSGNVYK